MKTDFRSIVEPSTQSVDWRTVDLERLYMTPAANDAMADKPKLANDADRVQLNRDGSSTFAPMNPVDMSLPEVLGDLSSNRVGTGVASTSRDAENDALGQPLCPIPNSVEPNIQEKTVILRSQGHATARHTTKTFQPLPMLRTTSPLGPLRVNDSGNGGRIQNQFVRQNQLSPIDTSGAIRKNDSGQASPLTTIGEIKQKAGFVVNAKVCTPDCECEKCTLKAYENELMAALDARQHENDMTRNGLSFKATVPERPFMLSGVSRSAAANPMSLPVAPISAKRIAHTKGNDFRPKMASESRNAGLKIAGSPVPKLTESKSNDATTFKIDDATKTNPDAESNSSPRKWIAAASQPVVAKTPVAPVEPLANLAWDAQLERTIEAFESQIISFSLNDYRKPQLQRGLVILNALQDRLSNGQIAIEQSEHRAYWKHQMNAILNMLHSSQFSGVNRPDQVGVALTHLQSAVQELRGLAELRITAAEFCSQVNGYGQFVVMTSEFQMGDRTLIYCEIENFVPVESKDNGQTMYRTRLKSTVDILDRNGKIVQQIDFPVVQDDAANYRRDFYMHLPLTFEIDKPGQYEMRIRIEDLASKKSTQFAKQVTIN